MYYFKICYMKTYFGNLRKEKMLLMLPPTNSVNEIQ